MEREELNKADGRTIQLCDVILHFYEMLEKYKVVVVEVELPIHLIVSYKNTNVNLMVGLKEKSENQQRY